jgi:hypothetical protein
MNFPKNIRDPNLYRQVRKQDGLILIELLGIIALILILSLILVPVLIKKLDRLALEKEDTFLEEMSASFRASALRTRSIPGAGDFIQTLSDEMGLHTLDVTENSKGRPRLLVIDPDLRVGVDSNQVLPFVQTVVGTIEPISPRLMILSSLGAAFPVNITNGVAASTSVFDELWALSEGAVPNTWSNWNNGRGDDLRVQRMHLADLFVPIVLNNDANTLGQYSIDSLTTNTMPASFPRTVENYYITDTVLGLHDISGNLETYEVVYQPDSYVFEMGIWRSRFQGVDAGYPGGFNLQVVADLFINAQWNPNAQSNGDPATQVKIITAMESFMTEYILWADAGFPSHPSQKGDLNDAQYDLETYTNNLLFKP